ncbi:MAG: hypothetical protein ABIG64_10575 [Candidatus Omnitrophota bacterium]
MQKRLFCVCLMLVMVTVVGLENSYAFWGKKKDAAQTSGQEPIVEKESVVKPEVEPEVKAEIKAEVKTEAKKEKVSAEEKPILPQKTASVSEEKKMRDKKREKLNNSSWQIEIFPIAGGGKKQKDVLNFKENRVYSEKYEAQGFAASNYTITIKSNGVTVWETMQTTAEGKIIFWRGEVDESMREMRGVLSTQPAPGKSEDFSFISLEKAPIKN